jgi:hypothetical protein
MSRDAARNMSAATADCPPATNRFLTDHHAE